VTLRQLDFHLPPILLADLGKLSFSRQLRIALADLLTFPGNKRKAKRLESCFAQGSLADDSRNQAFTLKS
jgi:hypothetical protein